MSFRMIIFVNTFTVESVLGCKRCREPCIKRLYSSCHICFFRSESETLPKKGEVLRNSPPFLRMRRRRASIRAMFRSVRPRRMRRRFRRISVFLRARNIPGRRFRNIRYGRLPALLRNCPFLRNGGNVSPRNTCLLSGTPFRIISIHWAVCGFNARFHRNDRAGSVRYSYAYSSKLLNNT